MEKKRDLLETLERMKLLVLEYKKWTDGEDPANVKQILQKTKDIQEQKATWNKLHSVLNSCQLVGTRYLEESNRLPVKKVRRGKKILYHQGNYVYTNSNGSLQRTRSFLYRKRTRSRVTCLHCVWH